MKEVRMEVRKVPPGNLADYLINQMKEHGYEVHSEKRHDDRVYLKASNLSKGERLRWLFHLPKKDGIGAARPIDLVAEITQKNSDSVLSFVIISSVWNKEEGGRSPQSDYNTIIKSVERSFTTRKVFEKEI